MKETLFILSTLFFCFPVFAQKSRSNTLNLGFTPSYLLVKDEVLSPMIYRGSALSIYIDYQRVKPKGTWRAGGTYLFGKNLISNNLASEFGNGNMNVTLGEIFWEYMRHLKTTDKLDWKVGLNNTNTFAMRNVSYNDASSISIYNNLSIATNFIYHLNHQFSLSNYSSFSLLSYAFYKPNSIYNPLEASLVFPSQFFDLQNMLLCTWKASKTFFISAGYRFHWLKQSPELTQWNFATAQQGFMLQTSLNW